MPKGFCAGLTIAGLIALSPMSGAVAQQKYTPWTDPAVQRKTENNVLQLVDELNKLVAEAKGSRAANPSFLRDLEDLARRYGNPWRVALVNDDFADGDFTKNPTWTVTEGRFWIERGFGLRSTSQPKAQPKPKQRERSGDDIAAQLFGALLNQALGGKDGATSTSSRPPPEPVAGSAAIHLARPLTNGFALELEISSWRAEGTLELGLYRGRDLTGGYRLRYRSGAQPRITLLAVSARGADQLATRTLQKSLEDKKRHQLKWTRDTFGEMVVRIDGQEVIRATHWGPATKFDGFLLVNQGGDYTVSRIAIAGTK